MRRSECGEVKIDDVDTDPRLFWGQLVLRNELHEARTEWVCINMIETKVAGECRVSRK